MKTVKNKQTPWGISQNCIHIADGIDFHSTAGHGGIELSISRQKIVEKKFPNFKTFCGERNWYEEDCDICLVIFIFPEFFEQEVVERVNNRIKNDPGYYTAQVF